MATHNAGYIQPAGFDEMLKMLEKLGHMEVAEAMLSAAEPILMAAVDSELQRHPGQLANSMKSTGVKKNSMGNFYIAYRATGQDSRTGMRNAEKMAYLINDELVPETVINGVTRRSYKIPADDIIGKALQKCEEKINKKMDKVFNDAISRLGGWA